MAANGSGIFIPVVPLFLKDASKKADAIGSSLFCFCLVFLCLITVVLAVSLGSGVTLNEFADQFSTEHRRSIAAKLAALDKMHPAANDCAVKETPAPPQAEQIPPT
jgi:hypothetical protein